MLKKDNNSSGKISLTTMFVIIAIIIILIAAWTALDISLNAYKSMMKTASEKIDSEDTIGDLKQLQSAKGLDSDSKEDSEAERKKREAPEKVSYVHNTGDGENNKEEVLAGLKTAMQTIDISPEEIIINNELQASQLLEKYVAAQEIYKGYYNRYAQDASDLIIEEEGSFKIIDEELKPLNFAKKQDTAINGYYFKEKVIIKDEQESFTLIAIPAIYGKTGTQTIAVSSKHPEKILEKDLKGDFSPKSLIIDSWISE